MQPDRRDVVPQESGSLLSAASLDLIEAAESVVKSLKALRLELPEAVWEHHVDLVESLLRATDLALSQREAPAATGDGEQDGRSMMAGPAPVHVSPIDVDTMDVRLPDDD